jgi:N-acetylneuraminate synthase
MDWPLLETVAKAGNPVICSTGGCVIADTDKIVTFLEHRKVDLALLHCVGIYPTEDKDQQLHFMRRMMVRYPHCAVGYSGHEAPDNLRVATAAVAMGARMLERHVGVPTDKIKLNAYSMNPEQTARWVEEILHARAMCGVGQTDKHVSEVEMDSLRSLARGVFASGTIKKGEPLTRESVFFAMPAQPGQTTTKEWLPSMKASRDYEAGQPLEEKRSYDPVQVMRGVVHEAKGLLREAHISLGPDYRIELSHHYGMDSFRRTGATIVDFVNREYCKKLIILLPGQQHPSHAHQKKEETFQILYGDMELTLDGERRTMKPGDMQTVRRGQFHSFSSKNGVVFEEISTTHVKGDSMYEDPKIASLDPVQRKTVIENW